MSSCLATDEALEKERWDRRHDKQKAKNKQTQKAAHLSRTCCKHSMPLPYYIYAKAVGPPPPALEATQHHRPSQSPTDDM